MKEITFLYRKFFKSKSSHSLFLEKDLFIKYKWIVKLFIYFNSNYISCEIHRKKFKKYNHIIVVGLKDYKRNVNRRTSGYAKKFLIKNKKSYCPYCDTKLTYENITADHIIPISKGGNNSQVNLLACCKKCNQERGDLNFKDFLLYKKPEYKNKKYIFL